jgi:hypothetical protein
MSGGAATRQADVKDFSVSTLTSRKLEAQVTSFWPHDLGRYLGYGQLLDVLAVNLKQVIARLNLAAAVRGTIAHELSDTVWEIICQSNTNAY